MRLVLVLQQISNILHLFELLLEMLISRKNGIKVLFLQLCKISSLIYLLLHKKI